MSAITPEQLRRDPIAFADACLPLNEKRQPWSLSPYQRKVLSWAFPPEAERLRFRTLLWSEPKKSGKTFVAALLALWWSFTRPHTEVIICANSFDQAQGRVFRTMVALIEANRALGRHVKVLSDALRFDNGTRDTAIPSDYKSAAGSRHSFYSVDEPLAIMQEAGERLFEELTPPPSEVDAWGLLTTTAGWVGESKMLETLYQRGLEGTRADPELPLYESGPLFMFWSHEGRQPWQTAQYYAEQKASLRPGTFARLHRNEWVTAESTAIATETWDACTYAEHAPMLPTQEMLLIGALDAAPKHDTSAIVWVARDDDLIVLVRHRIWTPKGVPLDFAVLDEHVRWMAAHFRIGKLVMDPYQLHSLLMHWQQTGIPAEEYPQTSANLTRAAETVLELLRSQRLAVYPDAELRRQALNATVIESPRGIRLSKPTAGRKVDALVALSMAVAVAVETPVSAPLMLWGGGVE
jgi:phage terminase large subunit-like protein